MLKGIPTDISEEEICSDLTDCGFEDKIIKRFGAMTKPLPICLVIIKKDKDVSDIYDLISMFYISIKVKSFKKSGPSQCHKCQRFVHGSKNCGHQLRYVKCGENHLTKDWKNARPSPQLRKLWRRLHCQLSGLPLLSTRTGNIHPKNHRYPKQLYSVTPSLSYSISSTSSNSIYSTHVLKCHLRTPTYYSTTN